MNIVIVETARDLNEIEDKVPGDIFAPIRGLRKGDVFCLHNKRCFIVGVVDTPHLFVNGYRFIEFTLKESGPISRMSDAIKYSVDLFIFPSLS